LFQFINKKTKAAKGNAIHLDLTASGEVSEVRRGIILKSKYYIASHEVDLAWSRNRYHGGNNWVNHGRDLLNTGQFRKN